MALVRTISLVSECVHSWHFCTFALYIMKIPFLYSFQHLDTRHGDCDLENYLILVSFFFILHWLDSLHSTFISLYQIRIFIFVYSIDIYMHSVFLSVRIIVTLLSLVQHHQFLARTICIMLWQLTRGGCCGIWVFGDKSVTLLDCCLMDVIRR